MDEPTQREELAEIILADLSCVNSSSIHPDGNRCRSKNYGCIWYADRIADALIPFIERGKRELAEEIAASIEALAFGQTFTTGAGFAIGIQDAAKVARNYGGTK